MATALARRTPRERLLIAGAGALLLVWMLLALVWQPLLARRAALEEELMRTERLLARARHLPPPSGAAPVTDDRPLPVIAATTAGDMGLEVRRLQPQGEAVEVTVEEAPFDVILLWIAALDRDHGVRLADLTLTRRPAPGTVAATLTLER